MATQVFVSVGGAGRVACLVGAPGQRDVPRRTRVGAGAAYSSDSEADVIMGDRRNWRYMNKCACLRCDEAEQHEWFPFLRGLIITSAVSYARVITLLLPEP